MKEKRKKIWLVLLIILSVGILVYDTYIQHFSPHAHEKKQDLTVEYGNAGNLLLSNIHEGSTTSLRIKVKNETDEKRAYQLKFIEVFNDLAFKDSATYSFSKENKTVEISSGVFPEETTNIYDGDLLEPGEYVDYVLTVKVQHLDPLDQGKSLQARIVLEEIE